MKTPERPYFKAAAKQAAAPAGFSAKPGTAAAEFVYIPFPY
jgi:hypothetical protein